MSSSEYNKAIRDFAKMLKDIPDSKTSPYDTQAEVLRIEGDTAWVHIPGGVDETPVAMTVGAKEGDTVQVRISGGNAWIYGNHTSPPTDDTVADTAIKKAEKVEEDMDEFEEDLEELEDFLEDMEDDVEEAEEMASFALRSANGKNTVYYSYEEPDEPDEGFKNGDTWFNLSDEEGACIYNWDSSKEEWVNTELGENAIKDLAITNAKIYNLDAAKITTGFINAGRINTLELIVGEDKTLGDTFDEYDEEFEDIDDEFTRIDDDLEDLDDKIEAMYGECNRCSYGHGVKIFDIECDGFVPFVGACIDVFFGVSNEYDYDNYTPRFRIIDSDENVLLNDLNIYYEREATSKTNPVLWTSNTNIQISYDGSRWNILNHPATYYHSSGTTGSLATKEVTLWNCLILRGTVLHISFRYSNTATGPLYIKVTGVGTFPVVANGTTVDAKDLLNTGSIFETLPLVMNYNDWFGNATWEYQSNLASKTATRYLTYIDSEHGVHVHNAGDLTNYAQLNSEGMTIYKSNEPRAFFGDYVYLGSDPNNEGDISTTITSDSMAIQSGDDPIFSVQSTGETENRNVYMLKTGKTSTIFSSAKSTSYTETKKWKIRLKPNTYIVSLGGYTGTKSFTIGTGSYPSTPISSMTGSHGGSVNTLTIKNGQPIYVVGTTVISEVVYTVELTAKRDSGTSTAATKRINWAAVAIYYTKEVYTADVIWNGDIYSNVGKNIYINGGTDYTDFDGPNLTTDYSITSSTVNTCKSFGWIDLYDGVYVVMVRARYEPSADGACHTWIQFSTKQDDSTCSHSCYNVRKTGYLWNQHAVMFLASPQAVGGTSEEETGKTRYYVTGKADVVGKWVRSTSTAAFQIRAVKIR